MIVVLFNSRQYQFANYRDARQFQRENGGNIITPQQQTEEPRPQQRQHRPMTPRKSIIPNMIGKHSGANMYRVKKFDPRNPGRYDEVHYD